MNHLRSGKCESCMMGKRGRPIGCARESRTLSCYRSADKSPSGSRAELVLASEAGPLVALGNLAHFPAIAVRTNHLALGPAQSSRKSLHLSSFGNLSSRRIRLKEVVSVMNQNSNKKRKRRLPRNTIERPDSEIMERIFGKRVKRELDKIAGKPAAGAGGKHLKPC